MDALPSDKKFEEAAAFLVFERPDLLEASHEKIAIEMHEDLGAVRAWFKDPAFRAELDKFLTWRVLDPNTRVRQLNTLKDISLDRDKPNEAIKAFDVLSRQGFLKVPERHEVDDRKTVEVTVKHSGFVEGGFVPESPFREPESRRARLGESVDHKTVHHEAGSKGPFDYGVPELTVWTGNQGEEIDDG